MSRTRRSESVVRGDRHCQVLSGHGRGLSSCGGRLGGGQSTRPRARTRTGAAQTCGHAPRVGHATERPRPLANCETGGMSYRTADPLRGPSSSTTCAGAQKMLSGRGPGDRDGGQPAPVRAGRRPGPPQVREPPAHGLLQAARRVRADRRAAPRGAGGRGGRGERRQPRAGRRAGLLAARRALHGVHAGRAPRCRRSPRPGSTAPRCGCTARSWTRRWPPPRSTRERDGAVFIHPFDHPDIIAGQGTVGLEILEQCPEVRTIVVGIGGGGLAAGIAVAVKALRPDVRIVGVQAEGAAAYPPSLAAGHPVSLDDPVDDGRRHQGRAARRRAVRGSSASWSTRSARSPRTSCPARCCSAWSGPSWSWSRPGRARWRRC